MTFNEGSCQESGLPVIVQSWRGAMVILSGTTIWMNPVEGAHAILHSITCCSALEAFPKGTTTVKTAGMLGGALLRKGPLWWSGKDPSNSAAIGGPGVLPCMIRISRLCSTMGMHQVFGGDELTVKNASDQSTECVTHEGNKMLTCVRKRKGRRREKRRGGA